MTVETTEVVELLEQLLSGFWNPRWQPQAGLRADEKALFEALVALPPPMDARFIADTGWVGPQNGQLKLGLLLFREHLQMACRCLLLDLAQQANQHIDQALSQLLMVCRVVGHGLSEDRVSRLRAHVMSKLPSVLQVQTDWYRAIRFGGLPSRLTFVLGMHRSGTSALTGMLAKAGLDVPDDLMDRPDDAINLKGYWESEGLMQVNDRLFDQLGRHWSSSDRLPSGWAQTPEAARWQRLLIAQLTTTCQGTLHPVIKDPRLCVLIEGLRPLMHAAAAQLSFLIPVRHPLAVARSLRNAQGTSLERGLALWIAHVCEAERQTRDQNRLIIDFDDLILRPDAVLLRCRRLLFEPHTDDPLEKEAAKFIDPKMQRQTGQEDAQDLTSNEKDLLSFALNVRECLVTSPQDDADLHQRLDDIMPRDVTSS
ncbi:hypothetical protein KR100_12620 [Synechococcus sp. KORDI-100]|nr:hypothetical protein KR100_12620 [Synechococcus sp. KORDI-100]